jgi:hypothetical protein
MRSTTAPLLALALLLPLAIGGCGNRHSDPGPAERAGHDVDRAARHTEHDVNEAVDEAGEAIDESTDRNHH